jgi:magnesium chelatase subunit D
VEQKKWETRIGLIEEANGGVLYVDEINLLPDNLADQLLDSAASGQHHLERDGITRRVESQYILIGTMNPEEGDLRPQLSDRFAQGIVIQDDFTSEQRVEVVRRRIQFDDDPDGFVEMHTESLADLAKRVARARALVKIGRRSNREISMKRGGCASDIDVPKIVLPSRRLPRLLLLSGSIRHLHIVLP